MATLARPYDEEAVRRPNIATADVQLPAVRDYEQVDQEISGTLHPTVAWFIGLGTAIFFLLLTGKNVKESSLPALGFTTQLAGWPMK